ncbi:hypothetical protein FACS1894199_09210 [Bacteroidia bacterium]|nr:hypothetical protein FACS1894199_09210 [Bacteroidia bacterium]
MAYSTEFIKCLEAEDIKIVRLFDVCAIKPFDCGVSDLNDFLFNDAKTHLKYLFLTTFLCENNDKTIAYYSLQNDLLRMNPHMDKDFEQELDDIIFDYSFLLEMKEIVMFPASKIGRFAVDKEFQRRGYGTEILKAIATGFRNNNKAGCQFITVDALNNVNTLNFYEKNGFSFVTLTDYNKPSRQR